MKLPYTCIHGPNIELMSRMFLRGLMSIKVIEELAVHMHAKLNAKKCQNLDFDTSFVSNIHDFTSKIEALELQIKRMKIDSHEARLAIETYQRKEKKVQ